jgi:hypothetical protein
VERHRLVFQVLLPLLVHLVLVLDILLVFPLLVFQRRRLFVRERGEWSVVRLLG